MKKYLILLFGVLLILGCKRIRANKVEGYYEGSTQVITTVYDPAGTITESDTSMNEENLFVTTYSGFVELGSDEYQIPVNKLKYYKSYPFESSSANTEQIVIIELGPDEFQRTATVTTDFASGHKRITVQEFFGLKGY